MKIKPKKAPLTRKPAAKNAYWQGQDQGAANQSNQDDAHFRSLSERFWSFTRSAGFASGEKTLMDVLSDLWEARKAIALGALIGLITASVLLLALTPQTRTQMIITPASTLNETGSAQLNGGNSALMRFIAQNTGGNQSVSFMQFENMIGGVALAKEMMADKATLDILDADQKWRFLAADNRRNWSPERLSDYIRRRVQLNGVDASAMRALQYWHPDPALGKLFLHMVHDKTDALIRESVRRSAAQRIAYLSNKVTEAIHPDHRRALTDLLLEQERLLMLASINQSYAAAIIEQPFSHYKAERPAPKLILPLLMMIGMFAGLVAFSIATSRRAP